jgi:hypothetical protein
MRDRTFVLYVSEDGSKYVVICHFSGIPPLKRTLPPLQVKDSDTGVGLCGYHLEDQPLPVRKAHSSVIMARLCRVEGSGSGQWRVQAMGDLGQGDVSNYGKVEGSMFEALRRANAKDARKV